jgi:hypothetical protein
MAELKIKTIGTVIANHEMADMGFEKSGIANKSVAREAIVRNSVMSFQESGMANGGVGKEAMVRKGVEEMTVVGPTLVSMVVLMEISPLFANAYIT